MRKTLCAALAAVTFGGVITPVAVQAQPPGYYYYDGRWVDQRQWRDYRDRATGVAGTTVAAGVTATTTTPLPQV